MARSEATIEIDLPAADVFPWLLESEKRLQWVTGLRSSEPIDDASYREVVHQAGQQIEATATVVHQDPPHALDVSMSGRGFEARAEHRLTEDGGRTRLTSSFDVKLGGLGRFAGGIVSRQMQRSVEASLARLKEVLEASRSQDAEEEPRAEQE
jgi:carbon monoxide dehydrogenase subunit G